MKLFFASVRYPLMALMVAYLAGYCWAWQKLLTRIEKHDNKWYDSYPREQVIARYAETFGRDWKLSIVRPGVFRVAMMVMSTTLLVILLRK